MLQYFYNVQLHIKHIALKITVLIFVLIASAKTNIVFAQKGPNDTILTAAVIYNGDTIEAKTLADVSVMTQLTQAQLNAIAKWTRLRNAVYVTYPYARRAGAVWARGSEAAASEAAD